VAVSARNSRRCTEVSMSHGSALASLVVRSCNPKLPLIIVISRRPSTPVAQFFMNFCELLTKDLLGKLPATLACDFNIHFDDLNDSNAKSFLGNLSFFGLSKHIRILRIAAAIP